MSACTSKSYPQTFTARGQAPRVEYYRRFNISRNTAPKAYRVCHCNHRSCADFCGVVPRARIYTHIYIYIYLYACKPHHLVLNMFLACKTSNIYSVVHQTHLSVRSEENTTAVRERVVGAVRVSVVVPTVDHQSSRNGDLNHRENSAQMTALGRRQWRLVPVPPGRLVVFTIRPAPRATVAVVLSPFREGTCLRSSIDNSSNR